MLGTLGIPPEHERLYVLLVAHPGSTLAELADSLNTAPADAAAQLGELAARGLVVAEEECRPAAGRGSTEPAATFRAASPSVALTPMLVRQRAVLDQAEAAVAALADQYRTVSSSAAGGVVEVVHGAAATRRRFAQLLGGARREALVIPTEVAVAVNQEAADPMVHELLRRGVGLRTVISRHHLQSAGTMEAARESLLAGVQLRVAEDVPMRMLVCDRANALLSLEHGSDEADSLVINGTAVVRALALLFEQYWKQARPLLPDAGTRAVGESDPPGPTAQDRVILSLLALGLADRTIAAQLDVSLRTVERRLRALTDLAGARSRFQLGRHAERHGWLPADDGMSAS
ncbi:hypothetical protein ABZV29_04020 [Streptomyces sp. NPDC005236]|uniref:helix-turn-helix transcriptional regulator n=1 Tax=Streptomyces sp. NPDC005236 TaxID=3157028 RepID=UPI0033B6CE91